jgi:hypothetical protein
MLLLLAWVIYYRIAGVDAFTRPTPIPSPSVAIHDNTPSTRRSLFTKSIQLTIAAAAATTLIPYSASARLESVNRPELLPKETDLKVIQVEKFLTTGQAKRMNELLTALERDTGFRVRVLCQAYPMTPGLAM